MGATGEGAELQGDALGRGGMAAAWEFEVQSGVFRKLQTIQLDGLT